MKKALITGAAGAVGTYLAEELLAQGYALTLIDNLQRGKKDARFTQILENPQVTFLEIDLTDPAAVMALECGYDHVYHLAAVNGTKYFYSIPHEVLRINILSLMYLLEWFRTRNAEGKFCFTSSNEAYAGALESFGVLPLPTPEAVPLVISDTYNPRWSYGGSKLIGELLLIHYAQQYNFKGLIVRPHNFYGPRSGYDHVIPEFSARALNRVDPFPIYGAEQTRSFLHLKDAARAMRLLMESPKTDGQPVETVHIGSNEEVSMRNLAEKVFDAAGWHPTKIETEEPLAGSVARRLPDTTKLRSMVDWEPQITLSEGIKETFTWYADNPKS